jgi:hypothetical protein
MNMLYESVKERGGTTIIVPSSAVDGMNLARISHTGRDLRSDRGGYTSTL